MRANNRYIAAFFDKNIESHAEYFTGQKIDECCKNLKNTCVLPDEYIYCISYIPIELLKNKQLTRKNINTITQYADIPTEKLYSMTKSSLHQFAKDKLLYNYNVTVEAYGKLYKSLYPFEKIVHVFVFCSANFIIRIKIVNNIECIYFPDFDSSDYNIESMAMSIECSIFLNPNITWYMIAKKLPLSIREKIIH